MIGDYWGYEVYPFMMRRQLGFVLVSDAQKSKRFWSRFSVSHMHTPILAND